MTTFSRSDGINNTNLNIKDLTPARDGQDIPAKVGQDHRLFHIIKVLRNFAFSDLREKPDELTTFGWAYTKARHFDHI